MGTGSVGASEFQTDGPDWSSDAIISAIIGKVEDQLPSTPLSDQEIAQIESHTQEHDVATAGQTVTSEQIVQNGRITPTGVDIIIDGLTDAIDSISISPPFDPDICVRIPLLNEGVCYSDIACATPDSLQAQIPEPPCIAECSHADGNVLALPFSFAREEASIGWGGISWEVTSSVDVWIGVDMARPTCLVAGADPSEGFCAPVNCVGSGVAVTAASAASEVADAAWDTAEAFIDEIQEIDLPTAIKYVGIAIVAIAIAAWAWKAVAIAGKLKIGAGVGKALARAAT